jgi:hypothetical protein
MLKDDKFAQLARRAAFFASYVELNRIFESNSAEPIDIEELRTYAISTLFLYFQHVNAGWPMGAYSVLMQYDAQTKHLLITLPKWFRDMAVEYGVAA